MDPSKLSHVSRKLFSQIEFDQDEKLVYEIRKHPFGLFLIYLTGFFVTGVLFFVLVIGAAFFKGSPLGVDIEVGSLRSVSIVVGMILTLLSLLITAIGAYLYQNNVVLVTNEKIAQILYKNLFDRKISQLSVGDVQDVTVTQKGLLARIFNFGTLVIETAGEQQNYTFTFTPNPYECGKAIVGAHEENLKLFGN